MNGDVPALEARSLSKRYARRGTAGSVALDDVSITVPSGAFLAVTGPSGGGKTTLLSLLGALDRPSSGDVRFEGQDVWSVSEAERSRLRRRMGFVFQSSPMIPRLAVWENVTYPLIPTGVGARARRECAAACLSRVGLVALLDRRPEELSGGELQRVGIARALVAEPIALLADEPTSNLDAASAEAVAAILRGVHLDGTTVVVATHDARLVALATATVELAAGRLRTETPPVARGPEQPTPGTERR